MDNTHLGEQQVNLLKAMRKRNRPAPFCNSFLFTSELIVRSDIVNDLVERGLLIKNNCEPNEIDMYNLTSDGKILADKLR
jgi:hypothetical protein